ncbi:hypothetical protein C8F04DRAFT_1177044 [Mycena alexandri]|uniref:Uncharacterized protein n=1 Tax=Mycena alexandri TaxID=1745969 RepID=A0AAD6T858_9AGAR|nr:hypothetical protein C8F04DRAFT_1177044 [Mycena alexandri]
MPGLDPDMYGARCARRNIARQRKRMETENAFHNQHPIAGQNAVAGPSRIPLSPPAYPQTLSQILGQQTSTYRFPQVPRGGVPIPPPHWAVARIPGFESIDRNNLPPYPAVMRSPRGRRSRASGHPTPPEILPLQNLSAQILQESPRLQSRVARHFGELTPQTPTSREHRGKRARIPPDSPVTPTQRGRLISEPHGLEIRPQQLFQNFVDGGDQPNPNPNQTLTKTSNLNL